jgi:hypothetical protein
MIYADVYNNVYLLSIKHYWFDCSLRYVFVCFKFRFILMLACIMGRETQICERQGRIKQPKVLEISAITDFE